MLRVVTFDVKRSLMHTFFIEFFGERCLLGRASLGPNYIGLFFV